MPNQNFWPCVKAMAAFLDGARDLEELTLDELRNELMQLKSAERMERRREIMLIIAQLSRLEIRMTEEAPSVLLKSRPPSSNGRLQNGEKTKS
jgi:hypothetical protein